MQTDRRIVIAMELGRRWLHVLIYGLVFSVLGVLAILIPAAATLATSLLVGWLLILAGAAGLVFTWHVRTAVDSWWYYGLGSLLTLILGLVFLVYPGVGIATLTILLVALFLVEGILSILFGLRLRSHVSNWGWMVFSGIVSFLVAALILAGWPGSAAWAIGLLVGINLLSTGISLIMLAIAARAAREVV